MLPIEPDFEFPGHTLFQTVASWVLGGAFTISMIALIVGFIVIAAKGFGNQQTQTFAAKNILWVFLAVIALASISGIFQLLIGFDLGLPDPTTTPVPTP